MRVSSQSCDAVVQTIEEMLEHAHPKQLLTEYDVQSWLFLALVNRLGIGTAGCQVGLHCQTQFLKNVANFGFVPDIAILNLDEYSILPDGSLYGKKGCTIWGDSILVEIKLHRGHRGFRKLEALKDIQKLADLGHRHYHHDLYFPVFVLACRIEPQERIIQEIQRFADRHNVRFVWRTIRTKVGGAAQS